MPRQRKRELPVDRVNIVGVVQSARGLKLAQDRRFARLDAFEVRLDAFAKMPAAPGGLPAPVIATVRDEREGGVRALSRDEREARYLAALPAVSAIDVELAFHRERRAVIDAARAAGARVILSMHDFAGCPSAAELRRARNAAARAGADVFKVAATPASAGDFAALLALLDDPPLPTSVMGMGRLGPASRLAAMACGSVLNYGWIERPNAPGQLSALELRAFVS